jgi:hypothetical protein
MQCIYIDPSTGLTEVIPHASSEDDCLFWSVKQSGYNHDRGTRFDQCMECNEARGM